MIDNSKLGFGLRFDSNNRNWHGNPEYNDIFLQAQENYLNALLQVKKFIVVNEVMELLGFDRSVQGMVYGWEQGDKIELIFHEMSYGSIQISFTAKNIYEEMRPKNA